jgi:hypothetical protein
MSSATAPVLHTVDVFVTMIANGGTVIAMNQTVNTTDFSTRTELKDIWNVVPSRGPQGQLNSVGFSDVDCW